MPCVDLGRRKAPHGLLRRFTCHREVHRRRTVFRTSVQGDPFVRLERRKYPFQQDSLMLVSRRQGRHDALAPRPDHRTVKGSEMIDRRSHAGEVRERRCAPLEPVGHGVRRRRELEMHEPFENGRIGDQTADVGAVPLVGARHVEVRAEFSDVRDAVRRAVHAIDIGECTHAMRGVGDGPHIWTRAEHVAGAGHRHNPGALVEQIGVLLHRQLTPLDVNARPPHIN